MKLNPDAVRDVLLFLEENLCYTGDEDDFSTVHNQLVMGQISCNETLSQKHKITDLTYATEQLIKERYVSTVIEPQYDSRGNLEFAQINDITWKGHQLLNDIRGDSVWKIVRQRAKEVGSVSLASLASGAKVLTTSLMSEPNSINNLIEGINAIIK